MGDSKKDYELMAKVTSDYKDSENASYWYWGMLTLYSGTLIYGLGNLGWVFAVSFFLFSLPYKSRKIVYFLVPISILIICFVVGGFGGLIGGGIFALLAAITCVLNYLFVEKTLELEAYEKEIANQ